MGWYDIFALYYDLGVESLYVDARKAAVAALDLSPGAAVLDLPVGTGQSLDGLSAAVGPGGHVLGVDLSSGMLRKAEARVRKRALAGVELVQSDVHAVDGELVQRAIGRADVDRVHVFLGMSTFPRWEEAFERLWAVLSPGGRFVIVDVYAEKPGLQGKMVELTARADLTRQSWTALEAVSIDFVRRELSDDWRHGGALWLATGLKPPG